VPSSRSFQFIHSFYDHPYSKGAITWTGSFKRGFDLSEYAENHT